MVYSSSTNNIIIISLYLTHTHTYTYSLSFSVYLTLFIDSLSLSGCMCIVYVCSFSLSVSIDLYLHICIFIISLSIYLTLLNLSHYVRMFIVHQSISFCLFFYTNLSHFCFSLPLFVSSVPRINSVHLLPHPIYQLLSTSLFHLNQLLGQVSLSLAQARSPPYISYLSLSISRCIKSLCMCLVTFH